MKRILFITLIGIFLSCSGETSQTEIDIFDGRYDSLIFSQESFEKIGFKFKKEYDVSELPDAENAYYGFWGESSFERLSYELRFYPSNQIAKLSGSFYADEASGEDAVIKKSDATWKEGIKDRSGVEFYGSIMPIYLDYVILGNMIVLCPSEKSTAVKDVWDPIENCRKMLSKLPEIKSK
ncbi:MAG: hypothetical protein CL764_05805 [Chloroflexi bacterium]|nr:hypothetical protein [Chloroflexota bacterium]|tara:strand:+ start:1598 stop:2137 length:540 start_codon:yes stop_codon:yes gene_type:complete